MSAVPESSHKGRILIVDDEEQVADLLQRWLAQQGFYARTATCFSDVQRCLELEAFDLVTLDVLMPEVGGLDVLRWLKEHYPDIGVVMASALEASGTIIEAMRLGAYDYLLKPFDLALIQAELEQAMQRQRLVVENRAYQLELEQKVEAQTGQLERKVKELEGRDRLVHFQMSGPSLEEAYEEIVQVVREVLEVEGVAMYCPNGDGERLEAVAPHRSLEGGEKPERRSISLDEDCSDEDIALVVRVFREAQPKYGRGSEAAVPLVYQDEVMGVLRVDGLTENEEEREEAANTLWRLGREAAVVLWSARVAEALESGQIPVDDLLDME